MPCPPGSLGMSSRRRASARSPRRAHPSPRRTRKGSFSGRKHMFEHLASVVPDPILGLMAAFRADPDPRKVDLGIGVYRDEHGNTPVLEAVRQAESALLARQTTKTYVGPAGNAGFNQAMEQLVLGPTHPAL